MFARILYMQRRMKNKYETLNAKCEVLKMYWDKVLFQFLTKAITNNDENMRLIVEMITRVPIKVQNEVIKRFIIKCK